MQQAGVLLVCHNCEDFLAHLLDVMHALHLEGFATVQCNGGCTVLVSITATKLLA